MVNKLLAGASVLAMGLYLTPAHADPLTISTTTTTPVRTSAAANNSPGDISTTTAGQVNPTSGAAITIDSNNNVTHAGSITITGADNSAGIQANAGVTGNITSSGAITVTETYVRTDTNSDAVLDGPYAQGTGRFGIHALGALTGTVAQNGAITIQGNNSAGVALDGPLTGSLSIGGTVAVQGDHSFGVTAGAISGNAAINGSISALGTGSSAVALNGNIGGALTVTATASSSGYSSTSLPASTASLTPANLLQGGPTFWLAGDVAGGANFASAVSTTATDGTVTTTPGAAISSFGTAPAVQIGAAGHGVTLGAIAGDAGGFGLILGGTLSGSGVYSGFSGTGVRLGGLGGAVNVAGGIRVTGMITGSANGASATGLNLASGTTAPTLVNSGTITATVITLGTATNPAATALQIDAGANLPTLTNNATITASSVTGGTATAILDRSGTLTSITNTGTISATGGTSNVAIDVSATTTGVAITQSALTGGFATQGITGDIRFGSGNGNSLTANSGSISGNVTFGGGQNNSFTLGGAAAYAGAANFGGGTGTLTIGGTSTFTGTLLNAGQTAVTINGGTLFQTGNGSTSIGSLAINGGTLNLAISAANAGAPLFNVAGNASFASGSVLQVRFASLNDALGTFTIVQAGSLTGAGNLALSSTSVPFLFNRTLAANAANTAIILTTTRKTAADLGLNPTLATIYEPAYAAALGDQQIGDTFVSLADAAAVTHSLRQLLPDFAGGTFDDVSLATRATTNLLADRNMQDIDPGHFGAWIQLVGWADKKSIGASAGYNDYGSGLAAGVERSLGVIGRVGVSVSYLIGVNNDVGTSAGISSNEALFSVYWRNNWGRLHAFATGGYGTVGFSSSRFFDGVSAGNAFTRTAKGSWNGTVFEGAGGLSYELPAGRFYLRPEASIDYIRLKEGSHAESGGGDGFDLAINARTSTETGVNGSLAIGYYLVKPKDDQSGFTRIEIEGGDRSLLSSTLGATTAHFNGGDDFTLTPEKRKSGWTGGVRLAAGNGLFTITGEVGAEKQQDHVAGTARLGVNVRL